MWRHMGRACIEGWWEWGTAGSKHRETGTCLHLPPAKHAVPTDVKSAAGRTGGAYGGTLGMMDFCVS